MTSPSVAARYKIPECSGEVLIEPPLGEIPAIVEDGWKWTWGRAEILGQPLAEFRRLVRRRALTLAAASAEPVPAVSLGGSRGAPPDGAAAFSRRPTPSSRSASMPAARLDGGEAVSTRGTDSGPWGAAHADSPGAALSGRSGEALEGTSDSFDRPFIIMGHQPVLFHPGVWMKFFLLTRLARDCDATGIHLVVDTDATGPIAAAVPARRDGLVRVSETLLDVPEDAPLEACDPPAQDAWEGFIGRLRGDLGTLPSAELCRNLDVFASAAGRLRESAQTLGGFLAGARRAYEASTSPPGYLEVAMSALADTAEFRAFALHLLQHPEEFWRHYNSSLDAYRRAQRIRSAANPFPDLGRAEAAYEMPFWAVRGNRRRDLFAVRRNGGISLRTADGVLAEVPAGHAGIDALSDAGIRLRPKAITLTMFARLCFGDLFIHGVSGGRYDRVTDALITEVFGCSPPPYVVATATLFLPLAGDGAVAEDRRGLDRRLMDLQHNPERHLTSITGDQRRLVDEKWQLIDAVEAMRPGPERRAATQRIREINRLLAAGLADVLAGVRERIAAVSQTAAMLDVTAYRGYPFFLFDPAAVGALVGLHAQRP